MGEKGGGVKGLMAEWLMIEWIRWFESDTGGEVGVLTHEVGGD
jgi:hypothetical protein